MKISDMNQAATVEEQYRDDSKLNIRKKLHEDYSVNKQGFGNWLYEHYNLEEGYRILELGSGNGDMWKASIGIISKKAEMVLSDISEGMVNIMKNKYRKYDITIKKIDIQSIPFPDSYFDMVIANMMLYHVPDLDQGLKEVKRVLKTGGKFYAATFGENGLHEYLTKALYELKIIDEQKAEYSFTLQKGNEILSKYFSIVEKFEYYDSLEIPHIPVLIEYIKTMSIIDNISEEDEAVLVEYFWKRLDRNGNVIIPKEYGTFICKK